MPLTETYQYWHKAELPSRVAHCVQGPTAREHGTGTTPVAALCDSPRQESLCGLHGIIQEGTLQLITSCSYTGRIDSKKSYANASYLLYF